METSYVFDPIGVIHSCFSEKFGIPRQPGLAPASRASLEIVPPYDRDEAFRELDRFSHVWIVFVFHGNPVGKWRPTVRPPRLGGNRRAGVFATRSGFRPNPIGISAVALEGLRRHQGKLLLDLAGIDLLDGTPVLDIKPYLPYADNIAGAGGGFADHPPAANIPVTYTPEARIVGDRLEQEHPGFIRLLEQVLGADPRPAYAENHSTRSRFGLRLYTANVRWRFQKGAILVETIEADPDSG